MTDYKLVPVEPTADVSALVEALKVTHSKCRCTACGDYFNSAAAFDKHRTGEYPGARRCMEHQERRERKMDTNAAGYWVTALREWPESEGDNP